jgi:hypothetical protein
MPQPGSIVKFEIVESAVVPDRASQRVIEQCARSIVSEFVTFLDRMIAIRRAIEHGFRVPQDLTGTDAILHFARSELERLYLTIAADRRLQNRQKVRELNVSSDAERIAISLLSLRGSIEHHGGTAMEELSIVPRVPTLLADNQPIESLPFTMEKGQQLGMKIVEQLVTVSAGQPIRLTEANIEHLAFIVRLLAIEIAQRVAKQQTTTLGEEDTAEPRRWES